MTISRDALRRAYTHWFKSIDVQLCFTGSVKQSVATPPFHLTRRYATPELLERNVTQVIERSSREILGRKSVRKGQTLAFAGVIEGHERPAKEGGCRLHVHLAISGIPRDFSRIEAAKIIDRRWRKSHWGYRDNQMDSPATRQDEIRWTQYMLKTLNSENTGRFITNLRRHQAVMNK